LIERCAPATREIRRVNASWLIVASSPLDSGEACVSCPDEDLFRRQTPFSDILFQMRPEMEGGYQWLERYRVAATLRVLTDKLLEIIGWIGIALFVLVVGGFIVVSAVASVHAHCGGASEEALRVLVRVVRANEKHDLRIFGKVGNIDAR